MFTFNGELPNLTFDSDQPHLYRTCDKIAYDNTIQNGVIWLRPQEYFQSLEDNYVAARGDGHEGQTAMSIFGNHGFLKISPDGANSKAELALPKAKHYIASFHGPHVDLPRLKKEFKAEHTFAIRNIQRLATDISWGLMNKGFNPEVQCGQVSYKNITPCYHIADRRSSATSSDKAEGEKLFTFRPYRNQHDYVQKRPIFSWQDEWRIIVFLKRWENDELIYANNDDFLPIKVGTHHFETFLDSRDPFKVPPPKSTQQSV